LDSTNSTGAHDNTGHICAKTASEANIPLGVSYQLAAEADRNAKYLDS
jgi:hypothetical protein